MITKTASYVLQRQQERIQARLNDPNTPGLVAWHSLGSGKSLTALNAIQDRMRQAPDKRGLMVVPAPLVNNMYKEIDKHQLDIPKDRLDIMSYDKAVNRAEELSQNPYSIAVLDEGHKLRNTNTKRYTHLRKILGAADKRLILTGTASYNRLSDIAPLINLAANPKKNEILPADPKEFNRKYTRDRIVKPSILGRIIGKPSYTVQELNNKADLLPKLKQYVDYHNSLDVNPEDFPTLNEKVVPVDMDGPQKSMYKYMEGNMPWIIRKKIQWGLPMNKQESESLNAFSTGVRQVSDSIGPYKKDGDQPDHTYPSPKIHQAVASLHERIQKDPGHRAVVYSNFIEAGLKPYAAELKKRGIPHTIFTGGVTQKEKKKIVDGYNDLTPGTGPKVLLLSSSGGEGLDLKGVRQVQVLEPHFNKSKIDQVVGRARRYKSHAHLPQDQRNVDVEYFHSQMPRGLISRFITKNPSKNIDQYLYESANEKDKLTQQLVDVVKGSSGGPS